MKLTVHKLVTDDCVVGIRIEGDEDTGICVMGEEDVSGIARKIAFSVNMFEPMAAALTPFGSAGMGELLADIVETLPSTVDEEKSDLAREQFRKLINAVDVILKVIEVTRKLENGGGIG